MKKILLIVLLAGMSAVASDAIEKDALGGFAPIDGAKLYKQKCSLCHGKDGHKVPENSKGPLAGRDAKKLALEIRAYRDQDTLNAPYAMQKSSALMKSETESLSDLQISAIAQYISNLK
jgi:cytochrome c553